MPIASPAQDKLNAIGIDAICEMIESGKAQTEIAEELSAQDDGVKVSQPSLNAWLWRDPDRSARAKIAMQLSAEAWMDRGRQALKDAERDSNEIARARALEQHYARRAAIRNPRTHGQKVELAGDPERPLAAAVFNVTLTDSDATGSVPSQK